MQDKTYKIVCSECNGSNIEQKAWIDPNTDSILDSCSDNEEEDNWCRDCNEHVKFKTIELYQK